MNFQHFPIQIYEEANNLAVKRSTINPGSAFEQTWPIAREGVGMGEVILIVTKTFCYFNHIL